MTTGDSTNRESTPVISVQDITKVYGEGDSAFRAVDSVDFDIEPGTVVGILGPNGAGKTTLLKMILGLVKPTRGSIQFAGTDGTDDRLDRYHHVAAMLEGARNIYWRLTVRENLAFFASLNGIDPDDASDRHEQLLEQFGLTEKADTPISELSRGMKQKASLICTLARQTNVVFLDEPTLGLDIESSLELRREIRRLTEVESMTVVLSSHNMDLVEAICDRVIILHDGRIIEDSSVDELIDLFQTQSYRISTEPSLPDHLRTMLTEHYDAHSWTRTSDQIQFEVRLQSGNSFYELMETLHQKEVTLLSVRSLEQNLSDAFLKLTDDATPANLLQEDHQ